jgi:hypothetical protein
MKAEPREEKGRWMLGGVAGPARMGRAAGRSDLLLHFLTILSTAPALLLCSTTRAAGFCEELEPPPRVVAALLEEETGGEVHQGKGEREGRRR